MKTTLTQCSIVLALTAGAVAVHAQSTVIPSFAEEPLRSESRMPKAFQEPSIAAADAQVNAPTLTVDALAALPFLGKYRKTAKTTMVTAGTLEIHKTVAALVQWLHTRQPEQLVRINYAKTHDGKDLGDDNDEPRLVPEEMHRVAVTGYLRAIKWEASGDNDFHVMVCDSPVAFVAPCFTVEMSGVPASASAATQAKFRAVRKQLLAITGVLGFSDRFVKPTQPPRVRVTGGVFLDAKHAAGVVGPTDAKSVTSYELHPVSSIVPAK